MDQDHERDRQIVECFGKGAVGGGRLVRQLRDSGSGSRGGYEQLLTTQIYDISCVKQRQEKMFLCRKVLYLIYLLSLLNIFSSINFMSA